MPLVACVKLVRMRRLESSVDRAAADYNRLLDQQEDSANRAQLIHNLEDLDRARVILSKLQEHILGAGGPGSHEVNMALIWVENAYNAIYDGV